MHKITALSPEEHKIFSEFFNSNLIVGIASCSVCGRHDVLAENGNGLEGDSTLNFLRDHYPHNPGKITDDEALCAGSGKMLKDL